MKLVSLPITKRPREKLVKFGSKNLKTYELLAILLGTGLEGLNVLELSQAILKTYPTESLANLQYKDLAHIRGLSIGKISTILAAIELGYRSQECHKQKYDKTTIDSPSKAVEILKEIQNQSKEHFAAIYLDARSQLIHYEILSIGILDSSLVHPREVFEPAIRHLSAYIILAHNHPSGDLTPSQADINITKQLSKAGEIIGIEILDHLILSKEGFVSLKDYGCFLD